MSKSKIKSKTCSKKRVSKKQSVKKSVSKSEPIKQPEVKAAPRTRSKRNEYCNNASLLAELIKWRDSAKNPENRVLSEELGKMLLEIARRVTNHSYFRNYSKETKEDFMSYGLLKVIKGLKGYNFKYTNAFAYVTTAFFNAYRSECIKYYKQVNIKKDLLKKYISDIEAEMPQSSVGKCLKNQFNGDDDYTGGYEE